MKLILLLCEKILIWGIAESIISHLGSMWGSDMENRSVELWNDMCQEGKKWSYIISII